MIRAGVGPASRGRRRVAHPGPEVVPSACLNHAWAGEGKEMERVRGGGFEMKMKGELGGGGGGGVVLNRWVRVVGRFSHLMFINGF